MGAVSGRTSLSTPTGAEDSEFARFSRETQEFPFRILAHGDAEACGYALAVIANGGTVEDIEPVRRELKESYMILRYPDLCG